MSGGMDSPQPSKRETDNPVNRERTELYVVLLALVLVIAAIAAITPLHLGR
jgi:hypothetical protein